MDPVDCRFLRIHPTRLGVTQGVAGGDLPRLGHGAHPRGSERRSKGLLMAGASRAP